MSRREIRRMLMGPRHRFIDRPWVMPVLVGLILLIVGLGIGAILSLPSGKPDNSESIAWEQTEMAVGRPRALNATLPPIVTLQPPRPDGAVDGEGDNDSEDEAGPQAAGGTDAPQAPELPMPGLPVQEAGMPVVPPPAAKPVPPNNPAWVRHAVPSPKTAGRPMIAVVIDDLGVDKRRSERVTTLRAPLTLAWMTYAEDLPRITHAARQRGHELMLHVPMQPLGESWDPGPDVLEVGVPPEENRRRLIWGLDRFEGFVGINNHMGSKYTGDRAGMRVVMEELKKRGLLFLDSVTTDKSVAPELARSHEVPFATRHVFLDNQQSVASIMGQLAKAEAYARKHGAVIAIGHPHDATIEALSHWLPGLDAKGFVQVPVTAILKANGKPG